METRSVLLLDVSAGVLSTPLLIAAALVAVIAWMLLHRFFATAHPLAKVFRFVVGVCVGSVALLFVFYSLERFVTLATTWDLAVVAAVGAFAIESVVALYQLERQAVPAKIRRWTGFFRVSTIALVLLILLEPTFTQETTFIDEREVAVLVDDSASMDRSDAQATASEKLALAEMLLPGRLPERYAVARASEEFRSAERQLSAEIQWLERFSRGGDVESESDDKTLADRCEAFRDTLRNVMAMAQTRRDELRQTLAGRELPEPAKESIVAAADALDEGVAGTVAEAQQIAGAADTVVLREHAPQLLEKLRSAATALAIAVDAVGKLQPVLDQFEYDNLSDELRSEVDSAAARPRRELVAAILHGVGDERSGMLDKLKEKYSIRFYRFASNSAETTPTEWELSDVPQSARQSTDLVSAIERVKTDIPARKLSGVVVVSDGRHNARRSLDAVARQPDMNTAAINSVIVGSAALVTDAAVMSVRSPSRVQADDRFVIRAHVKIDGLQGRTAQIVLVHNDKTVDEKKISVPNDVFRTDVELGHTPTEPGLAHYVVKITPIEGERIKENNTHDVHLRVIDDPTKLLLIENRPRWEFRYLRRLFAERDKSVRLQHLLLRPDWIEGAADRPVIHASPTRKSGEIEATALPENEEDWMLFDAIILGDVGPDQLGPKAVAMLKKYVAERGGRLIVIAGQNHMPRAFADSPLAEMLPVTFEPSDHALPPPREPGFFARLTLDGERHALTRLDDNPEDNVLLWNSFPEFHLRYPITGTKPGATVLAFAMPLDEPKIFVETSENPADAERLVRERDEFIRNNALIAMHSYGAGRVLMLNFDGTWRLRYRNGDADHHRFWGQMMRWATTDKLPDGNDLARLGTSKPVYDLDQSVVVRARLRSAENKPLKTDGASIKVTLDDALIVEKNLEPIDGSPGMYEADIGLLSTTGKYRVTLDVDDEASAEVAAAAQDVASEFVVAQQQTLESAELTADRSALELLAKRSGGVVVAPADAADAVDNLGPGSRTIVEEDRYPLWHSWPLLAAIACMLTSEWILRKKAGLP